MTGQPVGSRAASLLAKRNRILLARWIMLAAGFRFFKTQEQLLKACLSLSGAEPKQSVAFYRKELLESDALRERYFHPSNPIPKLHRKASWGQYLAGKPAHVVFFYALIRELEPEVVVETGTAGGANAAMITTALALNGKGSLLSIDLPPRAGKNTMEWGLHPPDVGFLIPTDLRARWRLIVGDAKTELPRVLAENDVDIFIHDSLHTRSHMAFEFAAARSLMRSGSLMISDDIWWNSAWLHFVRQHRLQSYGLESQPNIAMTQNTFDFFETEIKSDTE